MTKLVSLGWVGAALVLSGCAGSDAGEPDVDGALTATSSAALQVVPDLEPPGDNGGDHGNDAAPPNEHELDMMAGPGGCSMREIRAAQALCSIIAYPGRSRGIHYCVHDENGDPDWSCAF